MRNIREKPSPSGTLVTRKAVTARITRVMGAHLCFSFRLKKRSPGQSMSVATVIRKSWGVMRGVSRRSAARSP